MPPRSEVIDARKTTRRALRRRAIVAAAAEAFAETGLDTTTLDEIGARVGLSKASLYYYVDSREDLVAEVLEMVLEEIDRRAADGADADDPPLARLRARAAAHVRTAFDLPAGRLIVANIDALTRAPRPAALMRRHEDTARRLLAEAVARGDMRDIDIVCAVKLLYGALNTIPRWYGPKHGPLDQVIATTWSIFLAGVAAETTADMRL